MLELPEGKWWDDVFLFLVTSILCISQLHFLSCAMIIHVLWYNYFFLLICKTSLYIYTHLPYIL